MNSNIHFTRFHLIALRNEIDQAGSFHSLMIKKKAISKKFGMQFIRLYNDIEKYKRRYLTGDFESLRESYNTEMPYLFWNEMHSALIEEEAKNNSS